MDESDGLENRCGRKVTVGSNPTSSAGRVIAQGCRGDVKSPSNWADVFENSPMHSALVAKSTANSLVDSLISCPLATKQSGTLIQTLVVSTKCLAAPWQGFIGQTSPA